MLHPVLIVDISSWVQPLHHFPREILEEFDLVGAIAKKFGQVPWNPPVWAYLQANTMCPLVDIGRYVSQTMSSRDTFRSSTWRCFKNNLCVKCSKVPVPRASNWWISWPSSSTTQSCSFCFLIDAVDDVGFCRMTHLLISIRHWRRERVGFVCEERIQITIITTAFGSRNVQFAEFKSEILAFSRGTFGCSALRRFVILKSWNA